MNLDAQSQKTKTIEMRRRQWELEKCFEEEKSAEEGFHASEILARLTRKLEDSIRQQISEKTDANPAVFPQLESLTNLLLCPICFEEMKPPEHNPFVLAPCGHTFCETCLNSHAKVSAHAQRCPLCRAKIQNTAPNYTLHQLYDSSAHPKMLQRKKNASLMSDLNSNSTSEKNFGSQREQYSEELSSLQLRKQLLAEECEKEREELKHQQSRKQAVLQVINILNSEESRLENALKQTQTELKFVQDTLKTQTTKLENASKAEQHAHQRIELLAQTLEDMTLREEQVGILVRGLENE